MRSVRNQLLPPQIDYWDPFLVALDGGFEECVVSFGLDLRAKNRRHSVGSVRLGNGLQVLGPVSPSNARAYKVAVRQSVQMRWTARTELVLMPKNIFQHKPDIPTAGLCTSS